MGRRSDRQIPEGVMALVNRIATEVAADEAALRGQIVGLIDEGRISDAKALLTAWDVMAAGDVLKQYRDVSDGRQG